MTRRMLSLFGMVLAVIGAPESTAYGSDHLQVSIAEVKVKPSRYDGQIIEVFGILDSGHLGVFLRSTTSDDLIRLRFPTAGQTANAGIVRDSVFHRLRELSAKGELPGEPEQKFQVRLVGRVRVLKDRGQPAKKYYPQIESPVEMTIMRVLEIANAGAKQ